jgi:hypothetical protein
LVWGIVIVTTQRLGLAGVAVCSLGALGAVLAMLMARRVESGVLTGLISIVGGVSGALVAGSALGVGVSAGPAMTLSGALLGSSIWVATLARRLPRERDGCRIAQEGQRNEQPRAARYAPRYLLIAVLGAALGPIVGACGFGGYCFAVNVHPRDMSYYFWMHVTAGAVAGLVIAIPYSVAWLTRLDRRSSRRAETDRDA